jgi:hypothetical protein
MVWQHRLWVALVLCGVLLVGASTAKADFVVKTCNGQPAPPWQAVAYAGQPFAGASDSCGSAGGAYTFNWTSATLPAGNDPGGVIDIPSGETLTHVTATFTTAPLVSGAEAFFDVDSDGTELTGWQVLDTTGTDTVDEALPNASNFSFNEYCSTSDGNTGCTFSGYELVSAGEVDLTLHDTGSPTVAATAGGLDANGTVSGQQAISYSATAGGSGVASVTVALGSTVLATNTPSCQAYELQPCPPSVAGTLDVNTASVPNGTYPVILTAANASGDTTPINVATVTVANPEGAAPVTTPPNPHPARHRITSPIGFYWTWRPRYSVTTRLVARRLPRGAKVSVRCRGRQCPFHTVTATVRTLRHLRHVTVHRRFVPGDRVYVVVSAPGEISERGEFLVRAGRVPKSIH